MRGRYLLLPTTTAANPAFSLLNMGRNSAVTFKPVTAHAGQYFAQTPWNSSRATGG